MQGSKINLLQMKPGDLIGLLNSTEFGEVINERTFRRHKNAAGIVGSRIDMCRYAAWLTSTYNEYQKQTEDQKAAKAAQRRAEINDSSQDISEIPAVVNTERRTTPA